MLNWWRPARGAAMIAAVLLALSTPAHADQWNDKTVLKFSAPVMVPGATLPGGEYDFELADNAADRNVVRIFTHDGHKLVATTQAIPTKRAKASGDVVLRFEPTDRGAPVALKAWFYPGSVYGHEFVYPEDQARALASRTKTLVLSADSPSGNGNAGRIHVIDAEGRSSEWHADASTMNEWNAWRRAHPLAQAYAAGENTPGKANVAVVRNDRTGMRVKVDDLEDNPSKYMGQRISVDAEVEKVLGPRMFTIDEPDWGDLDGEIIVTLPTSLAALVKDDDRVTIEGTVRPFVVGSVEHEWGWLGLTPDVEVKIAKRPVLVADRVIGGNGNSSLIIDVNGAPQPTGTSGGGGNGADVTSLAQVAKGGRSLVGRRVHLSGVTIGPPTLDGFVASNGQYRVFVLPALTTKGPVAPGNSVSVDGVVMQMPRHMFDRLNAPGTDPDVYIYAYAVTR